MIDYRVFTWKRRQVRSNGAHLLTMAVHVNKVAVCVGCHKRLNRMRRIFVCHACKLMCCTSCAAFGDAPRAVCWACVDLDFE